MNFEAMTAADIDAVLAIEERVQTWPWTRGNFRDALAAGYGAWLRHEDGRVAGFVVTMPAVDEVHLLVIGVAPDRQRAGLGSALLAHACHEAREAGCGRMLLEVRPSNAAAVAFYRRRDFVEIGRRRGYYPAHEGREDAIVMAKNL